MFFKHFFIYIQNNLIYFKTKNNKVINFHYLNKLYFNDLSIVVGYIKKSFNNYIVQLPNNHQSILFSKKKYKLEEKCLVQITHQKKPNKIKCRDNLILNGLYFTLSTFADKYKNINFANKIYSYRSKYPYLFIYQKTNLLNHNNQALVHDIKYLINKYLTIINTLVTNEEKKFMIYILQVIF